jgi:hypothetical protein
LLPQMEQLLDKLKRFEDLWSRFEKNTFPHRQSWV